MMSITSPPAVAAEAASIVEEAIWSVMDDDAFLEQGPPEMAQAILAALAKNGIALERVRS